MKNFDISLLNFEKMGGLIPAIIQDILTLEVLMLGFMNREALTYTLESGKVTLYSRTKQRLWTKGETSGNFLMLKDMRLDCDQDSLLLLVSPQGPTCHTGSPSCFNDPLPPGLHSLGQLIYTIAERAQAPSSESYTASLLEKGVAKIAQKVGEEGVEVALAACIESKEAFLGEVVDLLYHVMVLLHAKGHSFADVAVLIERRNAHTSPMASASTCRKGHD